LDGTYRSPASTPNDSQWVNIPAAAAGTSDTRTVIAAVNPRLAIFTDNNGSGVYSTNPCYILRVAANYVTIRGLKFSDLG
ncbi:hypothetical protein, partial [Mesorhizobium sp. WSM4983]|uniref:hypothetical protein n=1 Tax=Mesorhizobium sp. WSM4983 TaxID=3038540 RepID=UPI002417C505